MFRSEVIGDLGAAADVQRIRWPRQLDVAWTATIDVLASRSPAWMSPGSGATHWRRRPLVVIDGLEQLHFAIARRRPDMTLVAAPIRLEARRSAATGRRSESTPT
jgi:hypothetical protein